MATYIVNPSKAQEKAVEAFLTALEIPFFKYEGDSPPYLINGNEVVGEDDNAGGIPT